MKQLEIDTLTSLRALVEHLDYLSANRDRYARYELAEKLDQTRLDIASDIELLIASVTSGAK